VLECHKTTEKEKSIICEWKYDDEYAIYNSIPYEKQVEMCRGFANPKNNYFSFCDETTLIGYINLIEKDSEVILGIGVNPICCDQGYGKKICKKACSLSHQLYPGKPISLEVRTWNLRAVRCYEHAGFRIIGEPVRKVTPIGEGVFFHMVME